MNRIFSFAVAIAAALFACGVAPIGAQEAIRIPYAGSLSGPFVDFGERLFNEGVLIATEEVNAAGGIKGKKLEFYKVDVRSPDTAAWIAIYRRLCEDKSNPMLLFNSSTKMLFGIYDDNKRCPMVVLAPTPAGAWSYPDYGNIIFRYMPMPQKVLPVLYSRIKEHLKAKTVAISYSIDDEASFFNMKVARQALQDNGFQIVTEQASKFNESNFSTQVAAIRAANADIVVLSHQPGDGGKVVRQLVDRGITTQVVDTGTAVAGDDFWKLSEGKGKGALTYSVYAATDPRPVVQNFIKKWREKMKRPDGAPDSYVAATYDSIHVLARVLNNAPSLAPDDLVKGFLSIKNLETVSGVVSWNSVGEIDRDKPVLVQLGDNGVLLPWPTVR